MTRVPRDPGVLRRLGLLAPLLVVIVVLSACGSSKPSYCSDVSKLQESVKALGSKSVLTGGTAAITAQVAQVQSNVIATANAVKSHYAPQTAALQSSVKALSTTVDKLKSSKSAADLAQLPADITAVSTAAKNLVDATSSKCG